MIDEAMQFALDYCQEDLTPEETVRRGAVIVQAIHGRLGEIKDKEEITNFILGGVLKQFKRNNAWKQVSNYKDWWSWGDFCRQVTGLSLQTCYARMRIYEKAQLVGMTPQEVETLGSVADPILKRAKDRNDIDRFIDMFRQLGSRDRFLDELHKLDEGKPVDKRKIKKRHIRLDETQEQFYLQSLEIAAQKADEKRELYKNMAEEEALIFLMAQWRESIS